MDFTSTQKTSVDTEDDNVEKFFQTVPYCEENLSTNITYEYLTDSDLSTDSDVDKNQTNMGSFTDANEKDNKDDECFRIKKTPMKPKKQSCDSFSNSNITLARQNAEITNKHITEMDYDHIVKSSEKIENNSIYSFSLNPPKRLSYSPQKIARVHSHSASLRTSFSSKSNEMRRHSSSSFNYTGFNKSFSENQQQESVPLYKGYQLIGDSQLLRFAEQMLDMKKNVIYPSLENGKSRRIGYCVSGQNLNDLKRRLLEGEYKIHKNVIVLIGTNDMLQKTSICAMFESFEKILSILKKSANKIVFLTVPPVPKIHSKHVLKILTDFNKYIIEKADGKTVFVVDLSSHYVGYDNQVMNDYYESSFFDGRPDLIHLNKKGFKFLRDILDVNYFDELN
ncbi:uncharacterized protein LOC108741433 [Agrilus planipennis]|uniref:Uncharacterized protein LOC108741433 n=1 Tax=Agrilus planipennis TaxID=224129 RepID=A0A1W4X6S4_AGRPL|nr:uncharacterized protein LOC108741433 [Agrilus planipennis]